VLQGAYVGLLVLSSELHLLAEPTLDLACERVDLLLRTLRHLMAPRVVAAHLGQLQRLL